jgi:5-methylcytosine-specific restriction protein B
MPNFTWIPFFKELAQKLLSYKDRQPELIDFLEELRDQKGLLIIPTKDIDSAGEEIRLNEIDLFTFFATFNRGIKDKMRFQL